MEPAAWKHTTICKIDSQWKYTQGIQTEGSAAGAERGGKGER